jgi:hypothetical protein
MMRGETEPLEYPFSGLFWVVPLAEDFEEFDLILKSRKYHGGIKDDPTDPETDTRLLNHERIWETIDSDYKGSHPYNYYPRGRVVINCNKAIIYLNPIINHPAITDRIINDFGLMEQYGITSVKIKSDGSAHYRCNWDEEYVYIRRVDLLDSRPNSV